MVFSSPGNLADKGEKSPHPDLESVSHQAVSSSSGFYFPVLPAFYLSPSWLLEQNALTQACDTARDGFSHVPDRGDVSGEDPFPALQAVSFSCVLSP